jgi:hypothetical protein
MDEQTETAPKKKNLFLRLLAFLVTLALVAGAVFLVANRDRLNLDSLKRWFTYRSLERSDSGQAESFSYSGSSTDLFAALGDDLLVCSAGGVRLYSGSGACYVEDSVLLDSPAAEVSGDTAAVWSVGGDAVYLYRDRSSSGSLTGLDGQLLSVRLNEAGWLAVTTRESGYKAVVTVYDDSLQKRVAFRLSSAFVSDAVVLEDCKSLAVVSMTQDAAAFESVLTVYDLPTGQSSGVDYDLTSTGAWSLGNNVILTVRQAASLWCVGDAGVSVWNGSEVYSWSCQDRYLKSYALADSFAAMLVGKYRAGSQAELVTVDAQGEPSAGRAINEQVLSLSAAGRYVAVLTADRLDIYTQDLDLYDSLEGTGGAKRVLLREDGTALLIGSGSAHLYVP